MGVVKSSGSYTRGNALASGIGEQTPRAPRIKQQATANHMGRGRINLKAVAEVLAEHGMDPAVELVQIVQSGKLPADVQARILNELLQYTQPKLKSVEVRAKVAATSFDVNDDQAKRIAEEFLKAMPAQEFDKLLA